MMKCAANSLRVATPATTGTLAHLDAAHHGRASLRAGSAITEQVCESIVATYAASGFDAALSRV
jgi:hypothetical protein